MRQPDSLPGWMQLPGKTPRTPQLENRPETSMVEIDDPVMASGRSGVSTRPRTRCERKEGGAALVETAIVILPLLFIVFGMIEFGAMFKDSLSISSATRAGARTASAEPRASTFISDTREATAKAGTGVSFRNGDEMFIYKARTDGLPQSGNVDSCTTNCNRFIFSNGNWVASGGSGWNPATQQACLGATVDSVGVSLKTRYRSLTNFIPFLDGVTLRESTVMRLEPLEESCTS